MTTPSAALIDSLRKAVGADNVISDRDELLTYDCDGLTLHKAVPGAVVFVHSTEEVSTVVKACGAAKHAFVPRGAGTGLSGGALALDGAVVIELARMNRILEINRADRYAAVEAGVINLQLTKACAPVAQAVQPVQPVAASAGEDARATPVALHYAPDPSSQGSCTIGGNVAENAGGPHTLKYGVTASHLLGLDVVLPSGEVVHLGGPPAGAPGYDLCGLFAGSEGTFGIATRIWVKLTPNPEAVKTLLAVFPSIDAATRAVSGIIAAGIIPAALELIDQFIIRAVEAWLHLGFPLDAGAVLLIELDGLRDGLEPLAQRVGAVCREHGCLDLRTARDDAERALLWKARKQAFGALGRISPSFYVQDGVIPRSKLPELLAQIAASARKYGLLVANVFHAGDGNLHPVIIFDDHDPKQEEKALACNSEIMLAVVAAGGALSGEHGIGIEKLGFMPRVYTEEDMDAMRRVRAVFDPDGLCNTGKAVPVRRCGELKGQPQVAFGVKQAHA
ncbi:MAG: FAD-linked oxidase C-terminal domain-containing protein [Planctomycetota bacterium]